MKADAVLICAAAVLLAAFVGAVLWLFRLCRAFARERRENQRLRAIVSLGLADASEEAESLRRLRHDLRHYLQMIDNGAPAPGGDVVCGPRASEALPGTSRAISTLVRRYQERAALLGLSADIDLRICSVPPQALPDVCLVLSNLLENALEALRREGGGTLRARCLAAEGYLSVVVGNNSTAPLRSARGSYLSSKAEGRFGIGLATVRDIARRYGGSAEFTADGSQFRASVFLSYPAPANPSAPVSRPAI